MKIVTGILLLTFLSLAYSEEIQCGLGFSKPYVQDKDVSFIFSANITGIHSTQYCEIKFLVEEMISKQIKENNSMVLEANFTSNLDTNPREFLCLLNNNTLDCIFTCINNTRGQSINISVPAKMNPLYQSYTQLMCILYTSVASNGPLNFLAPPHPKIISSTAKSLNGYLGGINILNICFITDFEFPQFSNISLINLPILDDTNISIELINENITHYAIPLFFPNIKGTINIINPFLIPNDPKGRFCIMNIVVESSERNSKNPYSIKISEPDIDFKLRVIAETDNKTFWKPLNPSLLNNCSIFPNSHVVGDSQVTYVFQFQTSFTIVKPFTMKFKLISGPCSQTENIIIAPFLNVNQNCSLNNCECSFSWNPSMSPPLYKGKLYNFFWEYFTNPISISKLKFEVNLISNNDFEDTNKPSDIIAKGEFALYSFDVLNTYNLQNLSFDSSKTKEDKVSKISDYIITYLPKVPLPFNLHIFIEMPSNVSILNPPCDESISNCFFISTQTIVLKDIINKSQAISKYSTQSFKMQNPDCGGFIPIKFKTTFSSYESDNIRNELKAVIDTSTSFLMYYGLPCHPSPTILNISNSEQEATSTYEFNYTGCQNSFPLTHIQVEFPDSFTFGKINCYCNLKSNYTKCENVNNNNTILVNIYNYCSGIIGINSIINPKLPGPTPPIILRGFVDTCEKAYDTINGPEILIANSEQYNASQKVTDASL